MIVSTVSMRHQLIANAQRSTISKLRLIFMTTRPPPPLQKYESSYYMYSHYYKLRIMLCQRKEKVKTEGSELFILSYAFYHGRQYRGGQGGHVPLTNCQGGLLLMSPHDLGIVYDYSLK